MIENLKAIDSIHNEVKKKKVSYAKIVVNGTKTEPYYEIEYFDLSDNTTHIGYSSYDLNIVFDYLSTYFDIIDHDVQSIQTSHSQPSGDLISRSALMKNRAENDPVYVAAMRADTAFNVELVIQKIEECCQEAKANHHRAAVIAHEMDMCIIENFEAS